MKKIIFFLIVLLIFSCVHKKEKKMEKREKVNNEIIIKETKKADKKKKIDNNFKQNIDNSISVNNEKNIDNLLIDFIYKYDTQEEYYLALSLQGKNTTEIYKKLEKSASDTIFSNLETTRILLNDSIAKKYLKTDGTEKLIVFNENQEIIDTIRRKQFETYTETIDSYFVATYNLKKGNNLSKYTVISSNADNKIVLRKGKEIKTYEKKISEKLLSKLSFNTDYLYSSFYFINKKDTIKLISFADYDKGGEKLYLFRNNTLKDSLTNSFVIHNITSVPIETKKEFLFISSVGIPETDAFWDILTGINKEKIKFIIYKNNRLNEKKK